MKVFVKPTGLHSRAMVRVAKALTAHVPPGVTVVDRREDADLVVSHVIGPDPIPAYDEVVIQYCLDSAGLDYDRWHERWVNAKLTWSYYDLPTIVGRNGFAFYHAPLGVDAPFTKPFIDGSRAGVMTSGYVSGPKGEAIEEVAVAAHTLGIPIVHLGPEGIAGMTTKIPMRSILGIPDGPLANQYRQVKWVSGLRHVEGFELPALEGLCCGARPIVFDRADMRQWYDGHAVFVPECSGEELIGHLVNVLLSEPSPVLADERAWAAERFDWGPIARGFWERAL